MPDYGSSEESNGVGLCTGDGLQHIPMLDDTSSLEPEVIHHSERDVWRRHLVVHDAVALASEDGQVRGRDVPRLEAVGEEFDGELAPLLREGVVLDVLTIGKVLVSHLFLYLCMVANDLPRDVTVKRRLYILLDDEELCKVRESLVLPLRQVWTLRVVVADLGGLGWLGLRRIYVVCG